MFVHIQDQPQLEKGAGPIGVVAAPTRELAEQIHKEARRFGKPYGMRIAAGIGGLSKYEQFKDLKAGADVSTAIQCSVSVDCNNSSLCNILQLLCHQPSIRNSPTPTGEASHV